MAGISTPVGRAQADNFLEAQKVCSRRDSSNARPHSALSRVPRSDHLARSARTGTSIRAAEHANVFLLTAGVLGVVANAIAADNRLAAARPGRSRAR